MTLRQLLIVISAATALCWLIWAMVLVKVDPTAGEVSGLVIFYLSLFFSLLGTFFLASFGWRKVFNKLALEYRMVGTSFRQSFFFAILIVGILLLQSFDFLTWWNILILIAAVTIMEFLFISAKRAI